MRSGRRDEKPGNYCLKVEKGNMSSKIRVVRSGGRDEKPENYCLKVEKGNRSSKF